MSRQKARREFTVSLVAAGSPEEHAQALKDAARFLLARLARSLGLDDRGLSPSESTGVRQPLRSTEGRGDRSPVQTLDRRDESPGRSASPGDGEAQSWLQL